RTSQILDMILPEFKTFMLASAAGGDGEEGMEKYLNPFKRKRDEPVVYWSGIVDVNGTRDFTYPVPGYFNGSIRVMAVAVNETRIGTAQTQSVVRGDLVISPNAPTTVTPGDEFEVSVGISNNVEGSGKEAPISLTLKTPPSLEVVGNPAQTLKVDEGREGVAVFRVKVAEGEKAKLGSATLNFVAALDKKSAEFSVDVSVRPATPRYTQLQMGSFSDRIDVPVLRDLYPEYRQLEAGVSLLPLVLASGLSRYLADYEHLCTEQLVSQAMSVIVLNHRPEFGKGNTPGPRSLEETFDILRTRQNADGGFGTWVASVQPDEFASVYAVQMMLEAQERGETVPPDMLQSGFDYLQKYVATPAQELWELRDRAYAAYLLTRHAVVTTPILTSLRETLESRYPKEWKGDLAGIYLASSYQLLKQQEAANQLFEEGFGKWAPQGAAAFDYSHYYDPLIRDSQVFSLMARHFPEKVKALPATAMAGLVKPIADGRFNTLSASYLILAFDAYANQVAAAGQGKLGIAELDAKGAEKALTLPANAIPRVPFSPEAKQLRMSNSSGLTAYYAVSESGFDRKPPTTELRQGMEIQREYLDAAGKPVASLSTGDEITVRIRYRTVDRKAISDGALIDLLPGGFEPVMNLGSADQGSSELGGLSGAHANGGIQFAEAREDRVIFYGTIPQDMGEVSYKIKATNAGRFLVPPAYAESMYERGVQARSIGGQTLTVTPAATAP
ncbi:MAG: alpha-2-macroglobulin, partial [Deltaproteobacteria bacterium]|nr:alpha-2-macroglobulin [Deltaproteobacteria bacterium]